jgi:hypothetical protein
MSRAATALTLTPAERARTIVASASTLRVASAEQTLDVHRHGVVPDGSLLFQEPGDFAQDLSGYRVTATAVDVTTVPQPDRLRGTLTLAGPVFDVEEPLPAGMRMHLTGSDEADASTRLVRLVPDTVGLAWRCETTATEPPARQIPLADYRCAFPDPLLGYEAEWLPHLQADHAQVLTALARHELGWEDDPADLRISFDRAVTCGCDVREAFSALLERALPGYGPIC